MVSSDFCRLSRKLLFQWLGQWSNQKSFKCLTLTRPSQQMLLTLGRVMVIKCWLDQKQFESIKQQTRFLNQCLMTTVLTNICFGGNCIRLKMSLKQFGNAAFLKIEKSFDWKMFSGFLFFEAGQQTSENCSVENSISMWVIRLLSRRQKNCDWPKFSTEQNYRRRLKWKLLTHDMSWGRWEIVERSTWPKTIELFFTKNTSLGLNLYRPVRPKRLLSCSAGLRSP